MNQSNLGGRLSGICHRTGILLAAIVHHTSSSWCQVHPSIYPERTEIQEEVGFALCLPSIWVRAPGNSGFVITVAQKL